MTIIHPIGVFVNRLGQDKYTQNGGSKPPPYNATSLPQRKKQVDTCVSTCFLYKIFIRDVHCS